MAQLTVTQTQNYTGQTLLDIDEILFSTSGSATATFASNQFGPGLISEKLAITGDGFANFIRVNLTAAGTFSAAGWSFTNWSANDSVVLAGTTGNDTLIGTAFNDAFLGGAGADNLSGGGGNDTFVVNAGEVVAGEVIDGGTQTSSDRLQLATAGAYNFAAATVTGIELVQLLNNAITATFNGSQLGAGAINVVAGIDVLTQAIVVNDAAVDLSGVAFGGWGGVGQTIAINGTSATANTLVGSSQRDTIGGTGNSADTITGGGGADTLNGGGGSDVFRYLAASELVTGETVNGGTGTDTLQLLHSGEIDFRSTPLSSIERLEFAGNPDFARVLLDASQFGGTGIANSLAVSGDGGFGLITVTLAAAGAFSAAGWTFSNWNQNQDQIQVFGSSGSDTITGSSQRDSIEGGDGADILSGGGGDDVFILRAGDLAAGESIDGGSHVSRDTLTLAVNANLTSTTISGIERLSLAAAVSATLTGDQIGGNDPNTIVEVTGAGPTSTQSLTVNGDFVALSGVSFVGWGGANQTITINGTGAPDNTLIGSSQRDTINGRDNAIDTITGGGGADVLNGGGLTDFFRFVSSNDVVAGEVVNGGGSFDTLDLVNAGTVRFDLATLNDIESLDFESGTSIARFSADQIGAGAIASVSGNSAAVDTLAVNVTAGITDIDVSGVSFSTWSTNDVIELTGSGAANTITGSSQSDTIRGGVGADTLRGEGGNDIFRYISSFEVVAGESIDGGGGTGDVLRLDSVSGAPFDFRSASIASVEALTFTAAEQAQFSGTQIGSSDFGRIAAVTGGTGDNHIVVGGASVDLTQVTFTSWAAASPFAPGDHVTILGTEGVDTLIGSSQPDFISPSFGADLLVGRGGDDVFSLLNVFSGETINGNSGTDMALLFSGASFDFTLVGLIELEVLRYAGFSDTVATLSGTQIGAAGIARVIGSAAGEDLFVQGANVDLTAVVFETWSTSDEIVLPVTAGADTLVGSSQNDTFLSSAGLDTWRGQGGSDRFRIQAAAHVQAGETIDGGADIDTISLETSINFSSVTPTSVERLLFALGGLTATLTGAQIGAGAGTIAEVAGTFGADALVVNGASVNLAVAFTLWAAGQATITINGTGGNDTLIGSSQVDILNGGPGSDTYGVANAGDVVNEAAGQGALDRVQASASYALAGGVEIEVLETNDVNGTAAINLAGNELANAITGNAGANTITGGLGRDTMVGGGGPDSFVWNALAETGATTADADVVGADFNAAAGDRLNLAAIDANELLPGDQQFIFRGEGTSGEAGEITAFTDGTDTFIFLHTDSDFTAEAVIRVLGVQSVDESWFVL